ncbi:hypothetical protein VTN00DRAFT_621 [Thermoascus crustaceus]|uniref:uncharacterized protein n=1 Tax=Thermoascus crustaceus TaxID=5088 RepID=UPI00374237EE
MTSSPQPESQFQPEPSSSSSGGGSCSSRPRSSLLIPSKRTLLPPCSTSSGVHKTLNPSAVPAQIQIRRPAFSTAAEKEPQAQSQAQGRGRHEPVVIEFDASRVPQPFLEPGLLERMRASADAVREARTGVAGPGPGPGTGEGAASEEARRRRQEREAEYGSMAVRGRSRVTRRGGA